MKYAISAFLLTASAAMAHEGHDAALGDGAAHWLLSPLHGVGVLALGAVLLLVIRARNKG
ncbi:hypothetical protein AL036_02245 [Salipiger aestuarii]|uniref:Uncharacterized protein n=1 Tax=Salipiger aestuarii TaxID=568098 RepID=A0A327YMJ1_9RHOB|nr:hypothetical protein [Salipiger aestuarii]EIE50140.1 hypothetical protein C357_15406 [Citreicella sp. 357]KAA8609924.1 hypothetical protein AL036_02245 [Salipiger aestuarii]KAA8616236.1 hypothetical protein AL037_01395 [Salipiger aestuarii]KAB2543183.1 hypothetical protein AL035_03360 [Salipiger aestuarii]RAK21507.1 hypothetical protein ATI53_1004105 [Salipiger aestuarii]